MEKEDLQEILEDAGFENVQVSTNRRYGDRCVVKFWCDPD